MLITCVCVVGNRGVDGSRAGAGDGGTVPSRYAPGDCDVDGSRKGIVGVRSGELDATPGVGLEGGIKGIGGVNLEG